MLQAAKEIFPLVRTLVSLRDNPSYLGECEGAFGERLLATQTGLLCHPRDRSRTWYPALQSEGKVQPGLYLVVSTSGDTKVPPSKTFETAVSSCSSAWSFNT